MRVFGENGFGEMGFGDLGFLDLGFGKMLYLQSGFAVITQIYGNRQTCDKQKYTDDGTLICRSNVY